MSDVYPQILGELITELNNPFYDGLREALTEFGLENDKHVSWGTLQIRLEGVHTRASGTELTGMDLVNIAAKRLGHDDRSFGEMIFEVARYLAISSHVKT